MLDNPLSPSFRNQSKSVAVEWICWLTFEFLPRPLNIKLPILLKNIESPSPRHQRNISQTDLLPSPIIAFDTFAELGEGFVEGFAGEGLGGGILRLEEFEE